MSSELYHMVEKKHFAKTIQFNALSHFINFDCVAYEDLFLRIGRPGAFHHDYFL